MSSVRELLLKGAEVLAPFTDVPRLEAEVLLSHILGLDRLGLIARMHDTVSFESEAKFDELITRRVRREPVSYLTGTKEFYGLSFLVNEHTLIPRPETELLVEKAIEKLRAIERPFRVLDLGTGSGCIAVSIAHSLVQAGRSDFTVLAVDRSPRALAAAHNNAANLGVGARVMFAASHWAESFRSDVTFDLIVSNPPYIRDDETLAPELSYEPPSALFAGSDGLDAYRELLKVVPERLVNGGAALFEIGAQQGALVRDLAVTSAGLLVEEIHPDLAGHDRVITILKK